VADRVRQLTRLPCTDEGGSRYLHPNGYVIAKEWRAVTGFERVGRIRGQADWLGPVVWWEVYRHLGTSATLGAGYHPGAHYSRSQGAHATLREARAWCDAHPREGWSTLGQELDRNVTD
jgi:hypothetical protein